jgi:uncharacterized protein YukE
MEPLRELEAIWAMEYKHAHDLVGYMSGGNLPTVEGMNKTLRRLHWAAKQLSTAVNEAKDTRVFRADTVAMRRAAELVEGSIDAAFEQHTDSGPRKKSEKDKWDETWMKAYSAELEKEFIPPERAEGAVDRAEQYRWQRHLNAIKRAIDALDRKIRSGAHSEFTERSQNWYNRGGKKELKRFFDKLTPPTRLNKILPKNKARHYPSVLTTTLEGAKAFVDFIGEGLDEVLRNLPDEKGTWWLLRLGA